MTMTTNDGHRVALVLMKGQEADATLEVVRQDNPELEITDHATYWVIQGQGEISIDLERVSEEFGERLTMSQWLIGMSSYIGRVDPDDRYFRVTSEMLQLG